MSRFHKNSWGGRNRRSGNSDEKHYFGHDDRVPRNNSAFHFHLGNRPRVSFKTQRPPNNELSKSVLLACLDDDVQMAASSNNNNRQVVVRGGREFNSQRGRVSPLPMRGFRGGKMANRIRINLPGDPCYKIVIPYGHKYDKEYILNNLLSYMAPETFVPIMYKVSGNEANFYVDDDKEAMALSNCHQKITTTDGFKLQVKIFQLLLPYCEIDNKLKDRLKQVMSKRYVNETNALDLSKFHRDPDLADNYFCSLSRPILLKTVLDIASEHIPNLEALNLDGTRLHTLEKLNVLSKKFSKLKILYIGDNWVKDIKQIDHIKELKLEELKLTGNPVCNKYKTRQSEYIRNLLVENNCPWNVLNGLCIFFYIVSFNTKANISVIPTNLELPGFWLFFPDISDVRRRFPKLLRLDGMELPKPILFDVADDGNKLPPSRRMFVANAKAQEIASQFLQQYFLIFDSENRQPLLDAYDEHASFSMTVSYTHNSNKLSGYLMENRNLFRVNDTNKRHKLLKQGRLSVVSFISEMPQTMHYINTFTMDISLVTEVMMLITVTGLFKELDKKDQLLRHFNRTFIIVPEGTGYCIRNEQLHIGSPTAAQTKNLNTQMTSQVSSSTQPAASSSSSTPLKPVPQQLSEEVKQQMTATLSQQTNMNIEWSLKCLEEVQWNYDNALSAFQEFFKRGQIPSEAFNK